MTVPSRIALALLAFALLPDALSAQQRRRSAAHVHGESRLDIAYEDGRLTIELQAPGDDLVGFEHAPATPAQRAAMDKALMQLREPLDLFVFPPDARCSVSSATVETRAEAPEPKGAGAGRPAAEPHLEIVGRYAVACAGSIRALDEISLRYFQRFPGAQAITIRLAGPKGQSAATATRRNPTFSLKGLL